MNTVYLITTTNSILLDSLFGILVVFTALISLVVFFIVTGRISRFLSKQRQVRITGKDKTNVKTLQTGETTAICMALHLYLAENHDEESNVITIKRIQRRYSPWNSKFYSLNNFQ